MFVNQPIDEIADRVDILGLTPRAAARRRGPVVLLGGRPAHGREGDQGRADRPRGRPARPRALPHRLPPARHVQGRALRRDRQDLGLEPRRGPPQQDPGDPLGRADRRERRRRHRGRAAVRASTSPPASRPRRASRTRRSSRRSSPRWKAAHDRHDRDRASLRPLRRPVRPRDARPGAGRARGRVARGPRRSHLSGRAECAAERLRRAPVAAVPGRARLRGRRPPGLSQARGPQPHRRAQDQQRARPGAAGQAHGQARIIAETGAGSHGVAIATACALLGLDCFVYMGTEDMRRQAPNVQRMGLLGTTVVPGRRRARGRSRRPSAPRSATGSPTSPPRTTRSAPASARRRSPRSCATCSGSSATRRAPRSSRRPARCRPA